ncbi:lysylphosphatidylglycerol synthase domain-containing protein [Streptomyces sp. NBC_00388]|uniref:lysylphosphatidylglycerol synthase domain-containing protein n=1 Tax=Streptomyces sp. NBC_00388 TaxID=2975735 RepID=UPI002E249E15
MAVFVIAVGAGIALTLRGQVTDAVDLLARPRSLPFLLTALAANGAGVLLGTASWQALLADLGPGVGRATGARIYFTSFLSKFVPGRVWGLMTHIQMGRDAGVTGPVMVTVFLLNLVVSVLTGLALGMIAAPAVLGGQAWWLIAPALVLGSWVARPGILGRMAVTAARLTRRKPPAAFATDPGMRRAMGLAAASWLVSGLHLWAIAVLLGANPWAALPLCVGGFALATSLSSLALFLPDGWGAREALLTAGLSTVLPWQAAAAAAIASRLVCTTSEVLVAGTVLVRTRRAGKPLPSAALTEPETILNRVES